MATPPFHRSLPQNSSEAADAPPHHFTWAHIARKQLLARKSHGACFLPRQLLPREVNCRLREVMATQPNFWTRSMRLNNHGLEVAHVSGLNTACQLTFNVGGLKSHDSRASTCFSLESSKSWLRHPCFEAFRKIAWKILMRHLITLHVNRCSLASHRAFYLLLQRRESERI